MRPWLLPFLAIAMVACSTSRAPDTDAGPEAALSPTGTWNDCDTRWTFAPDGTTRREEIARACVATGRWTVTGRDQLHIDWDTTCDGDAPSFDGTLSFGIDTILLLEREAARPATYASAATPIESLTLVDDANPTRRTVIRLVGAPDRGGGSGCYWAEDGACGGLLSCTGRILQWRPVEGSDAIRASTACTGDCPCSAILDLSPTDEGFDVAYSGLNCGGTFAGMARAFPRGE